ncbi:pre-mRNA-splicing factor clf-1 [Diaporthe amygdali]|uniref:pre-mRNA-splicing factor clf-1 n=1 Tax=Phomopsis amygdali TaxID=1214568 RepID=UPI0022FE692C|nr:pre-mRNA-splicing factor clf-1 [Diaporthe amygdali]KAJ0121487.1 pre-mRNA-splicing factor clf-1 [Diaporthe amygdali]
MESSRGPPRVKNKGAAPIQISAEQLLREAVDRQEGGLDKPEQRFADLEELKEFQGRKRREYEDYIRRNSQSLKNWTQYTDFEIQYKEFARARSVFERALDVLPTNPALWMRYIDFEIKERNIQHARNLLDRAVTLLPRVEKMWYKYVFVQEGLGDIPACRQVFERWMTWQPDERAWSAYIHFERRYQEFDNARNILQRFVMVHPEPRNFLKWAKFEEEFGTSDLVREVFQTAIESLGDEFVDERLFIAFARYEAKLKEYDRARAIFKFALDNLPRSRSMKLHAEYTVFEKQFGDKDGVEDVILSKRRRYYEEQVKENAKNYDSWIDYANLEQTSGNVDRVREVYEKAVAQVPPAQEKRLWRRYIYLWIFYAIYEEMEAKDIERARQVYDACLNLIPHKKFTFAKVWLLKAQFEIRQGNLTLARKTLGRAIGMCPKDSLFKGYVALEQKLYEFMRCRALYEKHVSYNPSNCQTWIDWAQLERALGDLERARAIFELGIDQPVLDMPEMVWKKYIDFEEEEGEFERARALYERLLEKADHPKVWISYAQFELGAPDDNEGEEAQDEEGVSEEAKGRTRKVFERALKSMRDRKAERVTLLNAWLAFEREQGSPEDVGKVEKQMPRKVRKTRKNEDGEMEEYIDYVFPVDEQQPADLSDLMAMAQAWKQN